MTYCPRMEEEFIYALYREDNVVNVVTVPLTLLESIKMYGPKCARSLYLVFHTFLSNEEEPKF